MPILYRLLEFDLHKSRIAKDARIYIIETPGKKDFLPCVVSTLDKGRFITTNSITNDNRIRTGVFESSEETIDDILYPLVQAAYDLSLKMGGQNVKDTAKSAYEYIQETSGFKNQPHIALIPNLWSEECVKSVFKEFKVETDVINNHCKVFTYPGNMGVFFSKPDYVGLITRLPNNQNSVLLHNVILGLGFFKIDTQ